jgi:hypothetical protein
VFIVNTQQQPTSSIHINAIMHSTSSVLMAEAAALALAASVVSAMDIPSPIFLTDSQQLVTFNGSNHSSPPLWDIKHYTQKFINFNAAKQLQGLQNSKKSQLHGAPTSYSRYSFYISVSSCSVHYLLKPGSCIQMPLKGSSDFCILGVSPSQQLLAVNKVCQLSKKKNSE